MINIAMIIFNIHADWFSRYIKYTVINQVNMSLAYDILGHGLVDSGSSFLYDEYLLF